MAMPDIATIREYYMSNKWDDHMLQVAQVCKALSADDVAELKAAKAAAAAPTSKRKKKS